MMGNAGMVTLPQSDVFSHNEFEIDASRQYDWEKKGSVYFRL